MADNTIYQLGVESRDVALGLVGRKAHNLIRAMQAEILVPSGFCIQPDAVKDIALGTMPAGSLKVLQQQYEKLIGDSLDRTLTVRSSSFFEGGTANFSGLFNTVMNITSFSQLIDAIGDVYVSSLSDDLEAYYHKYAIDSAQSHMAVIVQDQISFEFSGLVHASKNELICELGIGMLGPMVAGYEKPTIKLLINAHDKNDITIIGNDQQVDENELAEVARKIHTTVRKLKRHFDGDFAVECGVCKDDIFVVQVGEVVISDFGDNFVSSARKGSSAEVVSKLSAMEFFIDNGLFNAPTVFLEPDIIIAEAQKRIAHSFDEPCEITIRYAHGDKLGLPRYFAKNKHEASEIVKETKDPSWTAILYPYLNVKASFELLISDDSLLVEHVPGLWESNNILNPDVILESPQKCELWKFNNDRACHFKTPNGDFIEEIKPVSFSDMEKWLERSNGAVSLIRNRFAASLPLNVHFVEDDSGQFFFLNIRRGNWVDFQVRGVEDMFVVKSVEDLSRWSGDIPLRLQITTERGQENSIVKLAERLSEIDSPVFADFGVLSHPAMVLREYGVHPIPTYLCKKSLDNIEYSYKRINHED